MSLKRGLTHQEAMDYVGVKRRTFDEVWRPRLVAMRQGACVIFDRADLDRLFDQFKQEAAGQVPAAGYSAANCRVVALAVNLAMREWGAEVISKIGKAIFLRELQKEVGGEVENLTYPKVPTRLAG